MAIGTTIDGLNVVSSLTANDEVPVWDAEASGEPTKKITAQNMTASVKTLGNLVNTSEMNSALAGKQNTLTFDSTPTVGSTNPVTSGGIATAIAQSTAKFKFVSSSSVTLNAGAHQNLNISHDTPTIIAAIPYATPNAAYVFANTQNVSSTQITIGVYNTATNAVTGTFNILIVYR